MLFAMKLLHSIRKQGLGLPVFALFAASVTCCALVAYRILAGAEVRHAYLVWNLFLAWLPLVFALFALERFSLTNNAGDRRGLLMGIAWLLFFPNAPYIFTDLVHVLAMGRPTFWTELMLILIVALTGFLAGFLSLQVMHGLAIRRWGRAAGWLFVAGVSGLAGFGVYLGRFTRLNSWDVLLNPVQLVRRTSWGAWTLLTEWQHTKYLILFSLFLLLGYVMLFALTQRRPADAMLENEFDEVNT
jgi:uncharacterized membrane protein